MAERSVSVRLSARVDQYVAAMAKAKAATTGMSSDSTRNLTRLGGQMQSFGRSATLGVTVPLIALGAGAVSMAAKFETAFAQMEGLANVPASEIDGLKESVLALAGEVAVAPQELAEGLYFAASAGLDAAAAMDAVELAARASAAGMGSTKDVVGLVASAVAAYGAENITAAEATDILTSTIREGRAEPAELASTLGRVLPIAAELGVSFDDVGASVALLTNVFGDTNRSVTAFQGLLVKLQSPTLQGKKALDEYGLSVEDIRQAISEDGLLGAFELLTSSGITGSAEAMAKLFDDIEGRQAAFALLNTDAATLEATFGALDNSTGSLGIAFSAVADTDAFKMKQAVTDIKVAMTEAGSIMLPIVADIASSIAGLAGWFTDLSPAVQTAVVAFAGLMAAAGPLTSVAGTLLKNWTSIAGAFGIAEGPAQRLGKALGAIGLIAGTAVVAWQILGQGHLNASAHIDTASDALARETSTAYANALVAGEATTKIDALAIAHIALSNAIAEAADDDLSGAFARLNVSADETLDTILALGPASGSIEATALKAKMAEDAFGLAAGEGAYWVEVLDSGAASNEELAAIINVSVGEVEAFQDALFTVTGYAIENKDEVNALALAYLDSQVAMGGSARAAVLAAEGIMGGRAAAMNAVPVYEEYIRQLTLLDPAAAAAALATDGLPPSIQALIDPAQEAAGAVEELADVAASSIDTMSNYAETMQFSEMLIGAYSDALDQAIGSSGDLERAKDSLRSTFMDFGEALDEDSKSLDFNTEAGLTNRDAVFDMADEVLALTEANIAAGKPIADVTAEYLYNRDSLLDAAEAAGLNRDEVSALIDTYGLTPELITTTVELAGDALAQWRMDRYLEKLDTIPPDVATQIEALLDQGKVDEAIAILNAIPDETVWIRPRFAGYSSGGGGGVPEFALGGYVPAAGIAQLHANEAVMPLSNPSRMRELAADPRIGEPLLAALSGVMTPGPSAMSSFSSSSPEARSDLPPIYVYNNGRDITPHDIARAIAESRAA